MPWLSIVVALLAYLMQPRGTADERRKALLGAALAGGATYAVSHYTDWGQENLGQFDGVIPTEGLPTPNPILGTGSATVNTGPGNTSPTTGLWDTLKSWGPVGTAAVVGTGAAAVTGNKNLLLLAALAVGAILLLK